MEHYLVWLCGFLSWYYFSQIGSCHVCAPELSYLVLSLMLQIIC
jgi:hypothetical protein